MHFIFDFQFILLTALPRPQGSDPKHQPYLLAAHMDVVPVDTAKWTQDPWSGQVIPDPETGEDFVWGRGAIDDKLGVMVRKNKQRKERTKNEVK